MIDIYKKVQSIKKEERKLLIQTVKKFGKKEGDISTYVFEKEEHDYRPIISAYLYDEPCDVIVSRIIIDKDGYLIIKGEDKEAPGLELDINPDDIFAGQLNYVIENIDTDVNEQ